MKKPYEAPDATEFLISPEAAVLTVSNGEHFTKNTIDDDDFYD